MTLTAKNSKTLTFSKSSFRSMSCRGFTLVEVIVVMAIITGLSAIGFGVFFKMQDSAKESETEVILNEIAAAMDARSVDISATQRDDIGVLAGRTYPNGNGNATSSAVIASYLSGDFDKNGTIDPGAEAKMEGLLPGSKRLDAAGSIVDAWNTPIGYTYPGVYHTEDNGFDLSSAGPDKAFGTADDIILK